MTTQQCASKLFDYVYSAIKDKDGRVRAEDMISAGACVVAERCIDATGTYDLRNHAFRPGSPVFSEKANELLCGDNGKYALSEILPTSVYGVMYAQLKTRGYAPAEFPSLETIFKNYAAAVSGKTEWGFVPLSIASEHKPFLMPLRVAYETRKTVDRVMEPLGGDKNAALEAAVVALIEALSAVGGVLDHKTALLIAMETINGMAKTAPMTDAAMADMQK